MPADDVDTPWVQWLGSWWRFGGFLLKIYPGGSGRVWLIHPRTGLTQLVSADLVRVVAPSN